MALSEKMKKGMPPMMEEAGPQQEVNDLDVQIAEGLIGVAMMEQGVDAIRQAASQENPITPMSTIITMMMKELIPQLEQQGMQIDPNVWLAENGAVDRSIDLMSDIAGGLPDEVKNGIFMEVVDQIKLLSNKAKEGAGRPQGVPQPQGGEGGPSVDPGAPPAPMQAPMGGV